MSFQDTTPRPKLSAVGPAWTMERFYALPPASSTYFSQLIRISSISRTLEHYLFQSLSWSHATILLRRFDS